MADLSSLLQLGQQMQFRLSEIQSQLAQQTVTCSAGGGMVQATADGRGQIRAIKIDPQAVQQGDIEMLERSEEHTSELQSQSNLVCRLLLEKKKKNKGTWMRPKNSDTR